MVRQIVIFAVAFSLATISGPIATNFHLPARPLVRAVAEPCQTHGSSGACAQYWYPAGPAEDTLQAHIFTDSTAELNDLQSPAPQIDFTDTPLPPPLIPPFTAAPGFLITAPVSEVGYHEIQFMLASNFWGCNLNFGNSACGAEIRQGIAHMIDKTSFTINDPHIAGISNPIDNPVPTSSAGGLLPPNPCAYDASFPQGVTGVSPCIVGSPGGTSYHLGAAGGANGHPWLQAPGSVDLNAAAKHFVNAGIAAGFVAAASTLVGVVPAAAANAPNFFIRTDELASLDLGNSLAEQICYLFTGVYAVPCADLTVTRGPLAAFTGFPTSTVGVNLNWGMYTAAYTGPTFFDGSLYSSYNSRFVSGVPAIQTPAGSCSPQSVPTSNAPNYMYLCNPNYDSLTTQLEFAPCLTAQGDPVAGAGSNMPTAPGNGICAGTTSPSSISAGIQAEAYFGTNVFTLPIFERTVQYGYLNNGWIRAINGADIGLPNRFTWMNTWNPNPTLAGTIRQGFSQTTRSVNPYIATTPQDKYIDGNIYDSLYMSNPLSPTQTFNWLTWTTAQILNSGLPYVPPPNTVTSFRFNLRNDVYFQDGKPVTVFDVAFSYLSMLGSGALLGAGATPMTGITILSPHQFDIGISSIGPFTLPNLTKVPILPGRYWTNAGSAAWDGAYTSCSTGATCATSQYTLNGAIVNCTMNCTIFGAALMQVDANKVGAQYDPIVNHILVGSGPFQCGTGTLTPTSGSGTCTSTGTMNPPDGGTYTLTRFGKTQSTSQNGAYFHSAGNLALWIWSEENQAAPIFPVSAVLMCYGQPLNSGSCAHWQQGIGASSTGIVSIVQFSVVLRFFNIVWVELGIQIRTLSILSLACLLQPHY